MIERPRFWVWPVLADRSNAVAVAAWSDDEACEIWAASHDYETADFAIVGGASVEVFVIADGSDGPPDRYTISGEAVPTYTATHSPQKEGTNG